MSPRGSAERGADWKKNEEGRESNEETLDQESIHDQMWGHIVQETNRSSRASAWLGGCFFQRDVRLRARLSVLMFIHFSLITLISSSPAYEACACQSLVRSRHPSRVDRTLTTNRLAWISLSILSMKKIP